MICQKCGTPTSGKFCGKCGSRVEARPASAGRAEFPRPETAGFRFNLGDTPIDTLPNATGYTSRNPQPTTADPLPAQPAASTPVLGEIELLKNTCVQFNLIPGVLARKISEKEMVLFEGRTEVLIPPGVTMLIVADGQMIATVDGGLYQLRTTTTSTSDPGLFANFVNWVRRVLPGSSAQTPKQGSPEQGSPAAAITQITAETLARAKSVSFVLMQASPFNCDFTVSSLPFAGGIRADVGMTLRMQITAPEAFYRDFVVSTAQVTVDVLRDAINPLLSMALSTLLPRFSAVAFGSGPELQDQLPGLLRAALKQTFPGAEILAILQATTVGPEIEAIRKANSEAYFDKQKIATLDERALLDNLLRSAENRSLLDAGKSEHDLRLALRELNRAGMVSDEVMDNFVQDILDRSQDRSATRSHALDLLRTQRDLESARSRFSATSEIEVSALQHQLDLQRRQLEGQVSLADLELRRLRVESEYTDERKSTELDFKARERTQRLQALSELDKIREQREKGKAERELAVKKQEQSIKEQENTFELEKQRVYAGMTFQQIMALNPNISAEAAQALAESFRGDKQREATEKLEQYRNDEMARMQSMMDRMMGMAEASMQQSAVVASGQAKLMTAELDRAHQATKDRDAAAVKTAEAVLKAAGQAFGPAPKAKEPQKSSGASGSRSNRTISCANCNAPLHSESSFCPECGESAGEKES
jgi:hypothetical protein